MKYIDEYAPGGYCTDCGQPCIPIIIDEGIGPYEFQGSRGFDHKYVAVSDCCQSEISPTPILCTECGKRSIYDDDRCFECYSLEIVE